MKKALVIGCGHMGVRRARLLHALGFEVAVCENAKRGIVLDLVPTAIYADAEKAISSERADIALICTPPASHIELARMAAQAKMNVFIEKPLADRLDVKAITRLTEIMREKGVWGMMGQSYRHLPSLRDFRGKFGDHPLVAAEIWAGQHLADWHPDEDYRTSYTARIGVGYESLSHALDLANWLFGEMDSISAVIGKSGALKIDGADTASCLVHMTNGAAVTVHCDFLQRPRDFHVTAVTQTPEDQTRHTWQFDPNEADEMYKREMLALKRAVELDIQPQPDLWQGIKILDWVDSAIQSSAHGVWQKETGLWAALAHRIEA